ncbi:MAG: aminotransferase class I/II-fold pyridoxal phosphate-dependent enzyme [Acidobacteriota bacterium]
MPVTDQKYFTGDSAVKLAAALEQGIHKGALAPGENLPTIRQLAASNSISPATVSSAFRLLRSRGLIVADGRRGTRVAGPTAGFTEVPLIIPPGVRNLADGNPDPSLLANLRSALRSVSTAPRLYSDELNFAPLTALAREKFGVDHIHTGSVAIVGGALDGIERVLREYLRPGDRVAVEDPCFSGILDLLHASSLAPQAVGTDANGIVPESLQRVLRTGTTALIVTPRAQNPTGAAFTLRRSADLRRVLASHPEVLVIEDDHAGSIAGSTYHTLSDSSRGRWAVLRSVSKALGPDLRLAFLAGDVTTLARVEGRQSTGIRWVSHILQQTVFSLLTSPGREASLARAAKSYADKRAALLNALREHGIAATGKTGLNVWIPVSDESGIVAALLDRDWAIRKGEPYRLNSAPAVRVTISQLHPREAVRFAADFAEVVRSRARTPGA